MFRYISLIAKNALRNRRRSILTVCSVAASLCLLGVMMAIYQAFYFQEARPDQALRLITRNRISLATVMPISYEAKIKALPGVREVMATMWFGGVYKEPKNMFARFAAEADKVFVIHPEFEVDEGQKRAFIQERTACALHKNVAARFGLQLGDRVQIKGDIFPVTLELTVRAIFDGPATGETLYFHMEYLYELLGRGRKDFAGMFSILTNSVEDVPRVAQAVDDTFRNSPTQTRTETEQAFQLSFVSFLGNVKVFLMSICAAVTFTILLVSANTMAMSARERIREVGVLKTLGFTNGDVLSIILGEAAFLSLLGGIVGLVLASGLTFVVRQAPTFFAQLKTLTIAPPVALALLLVGVLIGLISSFLPAWSASRTPILDSLRYTG
jgi:putative ABC transport system permease protein